MALQGASRVVIFEPMPGNIEKIRRMIGLNPSLPISLEEAAVSDSTGEAVFNLMPEETMGKLEKSTFQQSESAQQQVKVRTIALDDLAGNQLPEPDFIKIDVEGAEEFVLKGALNLLRRKKPMLMIEVHSPEIGKRCLVLLRAIYPNVTVMETGKNPEEGTPMI